MQRDEEDPQTQHTAKQHAREKDEREGKMKEKRREERERDVQAHAVHGTHLHSRISRTAAFSTSFSVIHGLWQFLTLRVESEVRSDSMAKFALADPVFAKAVKALSEEAQRNLVENGLSDLGVLDAYLRDPGTELDELALEPGDVVKLVEVWAQAKRGARGQRAEFARRGLDQFARWDKARKAEARAHEEQGPNELQRAAEAPPPWHCRRLPSRLARSTRLEGDSRAREKAEEEERQRWVAEVTELLLTLFGTPTADKAARTADPRLSAARMCSKVRASTIRSYVRAWRPLWRWWTGTGKQGLPSSGEAVLTYLEQRAAEPCAPSVLTRTRSALVFYEEAAGLPLSQRVSKCRWFCRQADALQSTLFSNKKGQAWKTHSAYLAAAEVVVVDTQEKSVLRCYAFWSSPLL